MRVAPRIELTEEEMASLLGWRNGRKSPVRLAERARIVLLAAEGRQDLDIAETLLITPKKAARWRRRFLAKGLAGLEKDAPRPGRTPSISKEAAAEIVRKTTQGKPENATHWSTRSMALASGISDTSVLRILHSHCPKPHRVEYFKVSNGPEFRAQLYTIVRLSLNS